MRGVCPFSRPEVGSLPPRVIRSSMLRPGSTWRFYCDDVDVLAECTITRETDEEWLLAVWQNEFQTVSEKRETRAQAVQLSNQLWVYFLEQGWVELLLPSP